MLGNPKTPKKAYIPPSFRMLDAENAKAELKAKREPKDANVPQLLSLIDGQLSSQKGKSHSSSLGKTVQSIGKTRS